MSDILIKGMKMPPKGEYTATIYVDSDGTAYIDFDSREMDEYTVYDGKCDLVEVPPHGRLIDGIAIRHKLLEVWRNSRNYTIDYKNGIEDANEAIRLAPTIIEAEDET